MEKIRIMASNTVRHRTSLENLACTWPRAATILGAVIANLVIWAISTYVGQVDLHVNGTDVGPVLVAGVTLLAGLVAWGLLAFLERRMANAWKIWRNIALAVLVISMIGPLGADEALGKTTLSLMHVFAGAIIIKGFSNTVRK